MTQMQDTQQVRQERAATARNDQARGASGLNIIAGIWLILAPFILGYSGITAALWNDILVGIAVIILAGIRVANINTSRGLSWVNVVLGLWLIVAPFVLTYSTITAALWNDIILGVVVGAFALWSAVAIPA